MFKFDFKVENEDENNEDNVFSKQNNDEVEKTLETQTDWYECEEIFPNEDHIANFSLYQCNSTELFAGNVEIEYMKTGNLLQNFAKEDEAKDIAKAEINHSDLIPGVYEGGAKIWECTDDLVLLLAKNFPGEELKNKSVLDLGCGSGILGIYALKMGAVVHFQDYNKDVLDTITIPNTLLNLHEPTLDGFENCKFFSGDWSKYTEATKNDEKFDLILTSETIYNPSNQKKLLNTFAEKLKKNGSVLLAGKTYYFGVGGGLRQFEELIVSDGRFESEVLWTSNEGVCREILEIKHKEPTEKTN